jgi:hypothetical protein
MMPTAESRNMFREEEWNNMKISVHIKNRQKKVIVPVNVTVDNG